MNFLQNISTREVVEELEKTKHKLQKSQTRLVNLSAAYKALQEEKKTLECTISAISNNLDEQDNKIVNDPEHDAEENPPELTEPNSKNDPQIGKLRAALAAMSSERAKMQELFQSDRKKIKSELEGEIGKLKDDFSRVCEEKEVLRTELKRTEDKLRDSVREMEADNSASKIANRELQKQLNTERKKSDENEMRIKKKQELITKMRTELREAYEAQEERANDTRLKELKTKYSQLESKYKLKSKEVDQLIQSVKNAELETAKKLDDYNSKTDESKLIMINETKKRENRLADLEEQISDLTALCSQLEKEKIQEMGKNTVSQRVIDQLQTELDDHSTETVREGNDYFDLYMKSQEELKQISLELDEKKLELMTTKEELVSKLNSGSKSTDLLEQKLNFDEEIKNLKASLIIATRKIGDLNIEIFRLNERHKQEIEKQILGAQKKCREEELRTKDKISFYEEQLSTLRERSQRFLMDKDVEIEIIRKELNEKISNIENNDSLSLLLSKTDQNFDTALILYAEQLARKDVEINSLRSKRKDLDNRVRQVQDKLAQSQTETLAWKEKFSTLERDSSPASKEYLKNLVLQYLAVPDKSKKHSMQTALMTILELSNNDIKQMKSKMSKK